MQTGSMSKRQQRYTSNIEYCVWSLIYWKPKKTMTNIPRNWHVCPSVVWFSAYRSIFINFCTYTSLKKLVFRSLVRFFDEVSYSCADNTKCNDVCTPNTFPNVSAVNRMEQVVRDQCNVAAPDHRHCCFCCISVGFGSFKSVNRQFPPIYFGHPYYFSW